MTEKVHVSMKKKRKKQAQKGNLYIKKKWNRFDEKYFVCSGPFLYQFDKKTDKEFTDVSYILGFFVEKINRIEQEKYGIKLIPPAGCRNQPMSLFCGSAKEREVWIKALQMSAKTLKIEDSFEIKEQIGSGQFSKVLKAKNKQTGDFVAVKKINKSKLDAREKEAIQNEIAICQLVNHPNVIRLSDVFETQNFMYLVMPLLNGDLFTLLKKKKRLEEKTAKKI
eukprot:UN06652